MPTTSAPYSARGVHRQAAPPAADVEQPDAGAQPELAADEVELGLLGGLQADGLVLPDGAGVDHRRPQDQPVEVVADVVVVRDGGGVATLAVQAAVPAEADLLRGRLRLASDRRRAPGPCAPAPAARRGRGRGTLPAPGGPSSSARRTARTGRPRRRVRRRRTRGPAPPRRAPTRAGGSAWGDRMMTSGALVRARPRCRPRPAVAPAAGRPRGSGPAPWPVARRRSSVRHLRLLRDAVIIRPEVGRSTTLTIVARRNLRAIPPRPARPT